MKMIIIKLQGGLGNQLFQYALGRTLALRNSVPLFFDISEYSNSSKKNTQREYSLRYFNIPQIFATKEQIEKLKRHSYTHNFVRSFFQRYFKKKTHIFEKGLRYDPTVLKLKPPFYIEGYWQSEKYFDSERKQIQEDVSLKDGISLENPVLSSVMQTSSVSVHIRRGDYISNQVAENFHGVLSVSYYQDAIRYITKHVEFPVFFIFSDDIDWVKKNIQFPSSTIFVSNKALFDYQELVLMSCCKHNIIANSSFSWWGAWLNKNANKTVIAPKKWFKNTKINAEDIIPKSWIKI